MKKETIIKMKDLLEYLTCFILLFSLFTFGARTVIGLFCTIMILIVLFNILGIFDEDSRF
jgi:hypothetical protein